MNCITCDGRGVVSQCCLATIHNGKCNGCGKKARHKICSLCHGNGTLKVTTSQNETGKSWKKALGFLQRTK